MSQLLAYLAAQARTQPGPTLRFVAGELWRRGRARVHRSFAEGLAELSSEQFRAFAPFFVPDFDGNPHPNWHLPGEAPVVASAERISRGEFEILGEWVPLGLDPDWHRDWLSGHQWALESAGRLRVMEAPAGADVKRPWELARFHHGLTLAAAAAATGDSRFARNFESLVQNWISRNPWPRGIHWAMPMEVALRAINWIEASSILSTTGLLDPAFARGFSQSLFLHGRHLWAFREWNPVARANHYLASVVGLLWLGALFEASPEGSKWFAFGRRELLREMETQTGPDGVVREGSTGYHAFVAELFLSAALVLTRRLARSPDQPPAANGNLLLAIERATSATFAVRFSRQFDFLSAICAGRSMEFDPPAWGDADDGRVLPFGGSADSPVRILASVGDALSGRAPLMPSDALEAELRWRFGSIAKSVAKSNGRSPHHSQAFDDSGFYFLSSPRVRASVRCGPLGVGGWANHAHNDQLSFEFSFDGRPVIVDPGLPCYSADPAARNLFRSTRYHNTVEIAGTEQNRFWPALLFRIVDDTRSRTERWHADATGVSFSGVHSGYGRLPERALVRRELRLSAGDTLTVHDTISLDRPVSVAWYFHLAPGILPELIETDSSDLTAPEMTFHSRWRLGPVLFSIWTHSAPRELESRTSSGWFSPRFGRKFPAQILEFRGRLSGRSELHFVFTPADRS